MDILPSPRIGLHKIDYSHFASDFIQICHRLSLITAAPLWRFCDFCVGTQLAYNCRTRNVRKCLACSPPPTHQCRLPANAVKLTRVLIDACCTQLNLVNSRVTGRKFVKFLTDVDGSSSLLTHPSPVPSCSPLFIKSIRTIYSSLFTGK